MLSVYEFLEQHRIENARIIRLIKEHEVNRKGILLHMTNDIIIKRILANEYGTATDMSLAKLCRDWVRKNIECSEGW